MDTQFLSDAASYVFLYTTNDKIMLTVNQETIHRNICNFCHSSAKFGYFLKSSSTFSTINMTVLEGSMQFLKCM